MISEARYGNLYRSSWWRMAIWCPSTLQTDLIYSLVNSPLFCPTQFKFVNTSAPNNISDCSYWLPPHSHHWVIWCCKARGFCESANSVSKGKWHLKRNKWVTVCYEQKGESANWIENKQTEIDRNQFLTKDLAKSFKRLLNAHSKNKTQNEFWLRKAKQRVESKKSDKAWELGKLASLGRKREAKRKSGKKKWNQTSKVCL